MIPPAAASARPPHGHDLSEPPATIRDVESIWRLVPPDPAVSAALARELGISELMAHLISRRGAATPADARLFLSPDGEALHDPSRLRGAVEAAELLVSAALHGRRIVVFGDYDVDGVTAVAQLRASLRRIGADVVAFIPHRLREGYGLKPDTVRRVLREHAPSVLITVDCGINAVEGVACARAAGVDVIVTDHHLVPEALPAGAIVVNPRQPGCSYPYKELAASAIALKIAEAVARRAGVALSRDSLLRAACLGTIADLVPLTGENRVIAACGLAALADARAPGLRALLAESGLAAGQRPSAEQVAFRIAPRLNAAGRIDTAALALSLLEERDGDRARALAGELSARNAERQALERRVVAEARARLEGDPEARGAAVIVDADPGWHRGVLGIAASRLAREYHRPVLLFGVDGDRASGSGRSIPGVSLHGILKNLGEHFLDFGGHDQAVGATMPASRFPQFRAEARALFRESIPAECLIPTEEAEAEVALDMIGPELGDELARLEPHGAGNPRPLFLARGVESDGESIPLGEHGRRGRLRRSRGDGVRFVAWRPTETVERLASGSGAFDILYRLPTDRPEFSPRLEIVAARPAGSG